MHVMKDAWGPYRFIINPRNQWDKVQINVTNPQRCSTETGKLTWEGKYVADDSKFTGKVILNDAFPKNMVGKYNYEVIGIKDSLYNITSFEANKFTVVFERVCVTLTILNNRIDLNKKPEINEVAVYESNNQPFVGKIELNIIESNNVGQYKVTVKAINDTVNGITAYTFNDCTYILDRIKITEKGASSNSVESNKAVVMWVKAVYEYDNRPFDGSGGTLQINNQSLTWAPANNRWEKEFTSTTPTKTSFKVTGIQDAKYGVSTFIDNTANVAVEWTQPGIPGYSPEIIVLGIILSLIITRKRARILHLDRARKMILIY